MQKVRVVHVRCVVATLVLVACVGLPASAAAQDTTTRTVIPSAASRMATRLRIVFRPPERGTTRERFLARGGDPVRALVPEQRIDSLIPQTLRSAPFVAICNVSAVDSARLTVRVRDTSATTMVALTTGLNRIALAEAGLLLQGGDVALWSLATRSGTVFLESQIERRMVRATPTVTSLSRTGIWSDALDLFVVDALDAHPLAAERLADFLGGVGAHSCTVPLPS